MPTDSLDRLERLFRAALLHAPEERAAFLDAACADDPALRTDLDALLAADGVAAAEAFLDAGAGAWGEVRAALGAEVLDDPLVGRAVGPYHVLRPLGDGGMGAVYLALREAPFRRYAALKILQRGLASPDGLARFGMERQILASLDHPHVGRLLDGGVTEDGLPYLVMEYVEGQPLTTYCDERRLPVERRLRLFLDVCAAVQYAHQNLVLHRDLKPSNVLVTPEGHVKLLDFGIAKLLNPHLGPAGAPVTRTEVRRLTPEYASPEQVRGEALTTASDVYSLGVVLYELLTGTRPHDLAGRTTHEVIEVLTREEPERPSVRVLTADLEAVARDTTPARLARQLRGDLDAICLKALRKEPDRRYGSVEELAQDVDRHLDRRPVRARRGSRRYRLGRFLRRHRLEAVAVAAVLLALAGGLAAALWQAGVASRERDLARTQVQKAEEVTAFLLGLFERADPTAAPGDTVRVREVLERGAAHIETTLAGQPAVQAELLPVIARAYANLGRYDRAADLMERALALRRATDGAEAEATTQALYQLADLRAQQGQYAVAEDLFREYVRAVRARAGAQPVEALKGTYRLWGVLHQQGRAAAADSLFGALLAMERALPDEDHPDRAFTIGEIAYALTALRRYGEAEAYFRRALAMERRLHGAQHPRTAHLLSRLAAVLNLQERYAEALPYAQEAADLNRLLFPEGHMQAASGLYHLGRAYRGLARYAEAEEALRASIAMLQRLPGDHHRNLAQYARALVEVYEAWGRPEAAAPYRRLLPEPAG